MIYKIVGETQNGRASCGHKIHKGKAYYIHAVKKDLLSKCQDCTGIIKHYRTIHIPDDLVEGKIPLT